jgi:ketosteroid isomerase-like protein
MNTITDINQIYTSLAERDYEAVMSHLADDCVWIAADNSPLADLSPYHGIAAIRSGVFERIEAGFEALSVAIDEIIKCEGERVLVLGYYHGQFRGAPDEFTAQVAHIWTLRDGRAVKFQQYLDTLQIARASGAV